MSFSLNPDELALVENLPVGQVIDLAADLEVVAPEQVDIPTLIERCIPRIVERARAEGLPFSKYDRDDLEALSPDLLTAIGRLQGITGEVTVDAVLRVGQRVYRTYKKTRPDNPVALCLPTLLTAVARASLAEDARPGTQG